MDLDFNSKLGPGSMGMTQYLRSSGILEAYEKLLTSLYTNGWPGNKSIYEHSAEEILGYGLKYQQEFKGIIGKDYQKKAKRIKNTEDAPFSELTKQDAIKIRRDPLEIKSKNSLDFSNMDKPTTMLSAAELELEKFRRSNKEDGYLQLDMTKPEKKDIVLIDEPDLNPDDNYYQKSFEEPPPDENVLGYSMKSVKRSLDMDQDNSLDVRNDEDPYERDQEFDDTHREDQLKGQIDAEIEDGVNIGGEVQSNDQLSHNENDQDRVDQQADEDVKDELQDTMKSQERPPTNGSKAGDASPMIRDSKDGKGSRASNRTPLSRKSGQSRKSNK